jgi:hypothetical protein
MIVRSLIRPLTGSSLPLSLPLLLLLTACGGPGAEGAGSNSAAAAEAAKTAAPASLEKAPATADTGAGAQTPADAKGGAAGADKPDASGKLVIDSDGADGVRRMASWDGAKEGAAITTKKAWAFAPNLGSAGSNKLSFGTMALTLVDVVKADAKELSFALEGNKYAVPAVLARAAEASKGLKKGAAARCSFGGSSSLGRIEAASASSVTCAFRFMDKTRKEKLAPEAVLVLDGTLALGAPALVRFEMSESRYTGMVLAVSGEDAWVSVDTMFSTGDPRAGRSVHKVKTANVTAIDASKPLKVGDPCLAAQFGDVEPCKITKVIDGGVAYELKFDGDNGGSSKKEWEMGQIAPAPEAPAKK